MKRVLITAPLAISVLIFTAYASTSGAHFTSAPGSEVNSVGQLSVSFNEAGLGNSQADYTLAANATYDWGCINGGGRHPQATNKETSSSPVQGGASFEVKNGRASGTVLAPNTPPEPSTDFSCPGGMTLVLADASYTDIVLTDTTNGVSVAVPDTGTVTFIQFKK